jgi:hypothetical protein
MTIHQMDVLDRSGHLTVNWDPDNNEEVRAARATFTEMIGKGYSAFLVGDEKGQRGERIRTFDPSVEEMILVPPVQGG